MKRLRFIIVITCFVACTSSQNGVDAIQQIKYVDTIVKHDTIVWLTTFIMD